MAVYPVASHRFNLLGIINVMRHFKQSGGTVSSYQLTVRHSAMTGTQTKPAQNTSQLKDGGKHPAWNQHCSFLRLSQLNVSKLTPEVPTLFLLVS